MLKEAQSKDFDQRPSPKVWLAFFDDETGPANIALEANVKLKKKSVEDLGDDFEGRPPQALLITFCWTNAVSRLAVLEAKIREV